jgi:hypothetical protein
MVVEYWATNSHQNRVKQSLIKSKMHSAIYL